MANKNAKFFMCKHCGNFVKMINNSGVPMICCGEEMLELVPNTTDGAYDKHVPVVSISEGKVTAHIGSKEHPMVDAHYIEWIYLETEKGGQIRKLEPGDKPQAVFSVEDDKPVSVYAYCNLHGLWQTKID